jgi:hypothetical protein
MKVRFGLTKRDVAVVVFSVAFAVMSLGAIGSRGRRRAKELLCLSNVRQWGVVFKMFLNDNNGYFMERRDASEWPDPLEPYYKRQQMLLCPEATKVADELLDHCAWFAAWDSGSHIGSYGINLWISDEIGSGKIGGPTQEFWRSPYVKNAADVPVFADAQWMNGDPLWYDYPPAHYCDLWTPQAEEMQRFCIDRHHGGINGLFMDFSARKIGVKELWILRWHRSFNPSHSVLWPEWMEVYKDFPPPASRAPK